MRSTLLRVGLTILLIQIGAAVASAQSHANQSSRVPVTVALSENRAAGSRFVVQRNPGAAHRDVVVLAPDASADEFSDAVRALLTARQREGDVPGSKQTLRTRPNQASNKRRPAFPWAARVLADLRRSNHTEVDGVGSVRAIQIWLPSQSRTGVRRKG